MTFVSRDLNQSAIPLAILALALQTAHHRQINPRDNYCRTRGSLTNGVRFLLASAQRHQRQQIHTALEQTHSPCHRETSRVGRLVYHITARRGPSWTRMGRLILMEAMGAMFIWVSAHCRRETTREVRLSCHDMASRDSLNRSQMTRTVLAEVTGATHSWETVRTSSHISSKGYSTLLLLCFPILILWQNHPATQDDVLRLCQSFQRLTREFMKEVVAELRNTRRGGTINYMADDESDGDVPRRRLKKPKSKCPGTRRRAPEQNALSVYPSVSSFPSLIFYPYSVKFEHT